MDHTFAVILRWTGRILVLAAPYVLVCAFFLPAGVQFLNPVVCPDGMELDNSRYGGSIQTDNERLELVCTTGKVATSAGREVLLIALGFVAAGLACLYVAQRVDRQKMHRPTGPTLH